MIGWLARDDDHILYFFDQKPYRDGGIWNARFSANSTLIHPYLFNYHIAWKDEPARVEIIIKEVSE